MTKIESVLIALAVASHVGCFVITYMCWQAFSKIADTFGSLGSNLLPELVRQMRSGAVLPPEVGVAICKRCTHPVSIHDNEGCLADSVDAPHGMCGCRGFES